ncbi:MAG: hypothetical protein HOD92_24055 [Deltaproteobacteria bacterium]|jgi:hypothetical protein|nr:hypothetical protein [Deltaproteobacteria bacterium]
MEFKYFLALSGWILALVQFTFTHLEGRRKNEAELLEKSLSYFERGTQARSIGISLVEGIWVKRKKYLDVITPIIISQVIFLLTEADDYAQEKANLIRLLNLLEKCLPHASDFMWENHEISYALIDAARKPGSIILEKETLRHWFSRLNGGNAELFDIETENSESRDKT